MKTLLGFSDSASTGVAQRSVSYWCAGLAFWGQRPATEDHTEGLLTELPVTEGSSWLSSPVYTGHGCSSPVLFAWSLSQSFVWDEQGPGTEQGTGKCGVLAVRLLESLCEPHYIHP